jgi:hypothetical protein
MRRIFTILALVVLLAVPLAAVPPNAAAYVLHGYHLLDLMLKEIGSIRELQVEQRSILEEMVSPGLTTSVDETVSYLLPGAFRSEFSSAVGEHIHVYSGGRSVTIVNQRIVSERESDLDRYKDLLLYNTREMLKKHLRLLGMAPDVSSVGRFQGTPVFVIGAQYPDEAVPQLWLDKNTFRPVRWLLQPASSARLRESFEIRYHGWRKIEKIWYPFQVEVFQGDRLLRKIQVARVLTKPKLSHQLFDIAYLKSIYPAGEPLQSGKPDPDGKSDVQKTIERFRRLFD